jgi:hypothetical protein
MMVDIGHDITAVKIAIGDSGSVPRHPANFLL